MSGGLHTRTMRLHATWKEGGRGLESIRDGNTNAGRWRPMVACLLTAGNWERRRGGIVEGCTTHRQRLDSGRQSLLRYFKDVLHKFPFLALWDSPCWCKIIILWLSKCFLSFLTDSSTEMGAHGVFFDKVTKDLRFKNSTWCSFHAWMIHRSVSMCKKSFFWSCLRN